MGDLLAESERFGSVAAVTVIFAFLSIAIHALATQKKLPPSSRPRAAWYFVFSQEHGWPLWLDWRATSAIGVYGEGLFRGWPLLLHTVMAGALFVVFPLLALWTLLDARRRPRSFVHRWVLVVLLAAGIASA